MADEDDFFLMSYVECDSGDYPVNGLSIYVPGFLVGNGTLKFTGTINPTAPLNLSAFPTNSLTSVFDATKCHSVPVIRHMF